MAKRSKKKLRQEAKERKDTQKFFTVVGVSTVVLIVLLYIIYQGS